jgi:Rrf2 family protein
MKLSTRGRYGLAALYELALRGSDDPVSLREVAEGQGLSENYLEQLFLTLRRANLVTGVRGAQGGYFLARPAEEITVGDVIRALEGPIAPVSCVTESQPCNRGGAVGCPTRPVWVRLAECMSHVLDSITLADLLVTQGGISDPATSDCRSCSVMAGREQHE